MRRIYFGRDTLTTDFDIWTASRPGPTGKFDTPVPVTELNTAISDRPAWISADGCRLYISRGDTRAMYVASKPAN